VRALFSCVAGAGHLRPLLPLAHAFADAGHEVAVATAETFAAQVRAAGFEALPAGIDMREVRKQVASLDAELQALPPLERRVLAFSGRFGKVVAPGKLPALHAAALGWKPDLIVFESADLAAPIVAAALGVPSAHHAFGRIVPLACFERAAEATEPLWRELGLEPRPLGGVYAGPYLDICPPSFQSLSVPDGVRVEPIRPSSPADQGDVAPPFLDRLPERPSVYVTLGTMFNESTLFRLLLDALEDVDCNVIMTVGRNNDPDALAPIPENAFVQPYIAQAFVLPHCAATVGHGGSGSTLAALAAGIPTLFVPQGADQFENAVTCTALGAGRVLMPGEVTAEAVREGVVALLESPSYRDRASVLAAEIAAMPAPEELVDVLAA
jgi:UDP:flavonoid glycosyltransferase YjiC (YdhE family)